MDSPRLSRQELNHLLLCLEQLRNNDLFQAFLTESQTAYDAGMATVLKSCPSDLGQFVVRERLIGGLAETKRFLDLLSETEADLNQKLNEQHA